jgi:GntR family transcriptional regulator, transcriptional repressor for pyruvate dehydrogenase complex
MTRDGGDTVVQFVEPVRMIRTFETAIANIVEGIERSRLSAGERLPNETELANQLGISKPTLRQALRVLERSGLLLVRQGKAGGIFLNSDFLPVDEITHNIVAEEKVVLETLRARRVIETAVTREAVTRANEDDFAEIERTVDLLRKAADSKHVMRADTMFHRAVARASHNRVLEEAMHVVYQHLAPVRDTHGQTPANAAADMYGIHSRQLAAMRNRDIEGTLEILETQLRFLEDRFEASMRRTSEELFVPAEPALVNTRPGVG